MKLLVCMGYWEGDKEQAIEVIDQASKLLSNKSDIVSLCYVHRFDATAPDIEVLARNREKFHKVYAVRSQYKYDGWPSGCNGLAYTILNHVLPGSEKTNECALILESDCVITRPDWDVELLAEWSLAQKEKKTICGAVLPWAHCRGSSHVNASALWGRNTYKQVHGLKQAKPRNIAWDYYYGSNTSLLARNSPLFRLDWKRPTITAKELFASPALVFHGVKDDSARKAINKKYNLK